MVMDFLVPTDAPLQPTSIHPAAQGSQGQESSPCPPEYLLGNPLGVGRTGRPRSQVAGTPPGLCAAGTAVQGLLQSV